MSVPSRTAAFDPLRQVTAEAHRRLEQALDPGRIVNATVYVSLLERLLGIHAPLEDALGALPWTEIGFDFASRRRTPHLLRDLAAFGRADRPVQPCPGVPPCATLAAGFGCLYVLEARTLGDPARAKRFRETIGIRPEAGGAFFAGVDRPVAASWRIFMDALTMYCQPSTRLDETAAFALATFQACENCLAGPGNSSAPLV